MTSVRHLPGDKKVEFAVAYTGIGIPPEEIPYIFERFHQVDSSQSRSVEGVGLGLISSSNLLRCWAAKIAVESEPDKGSTFTLTIPYEITRG